MSKVGKLSMFCNELKYANLRFKMLSMKVVLYLMRTQTRSHFWLKVRFVASDPQELNSFNVNVNGSPRIDVNIRFAFAFL